MAGRRAARPGELGKVSYSQAPSGEWVARARTRDAGGHEARPQGRGATKDAALAALQARARELAYDADGVTPSTELIVLLDAWIEDRRGDVRPQTARIYADTARWLAPMAGGLTVAEATPARIKRLLDDIEQRRSASARKQARVALKGALGMAVDDDAIQHNPILSLRREKRSSGMPTALTAAQVKVLRRLVRERAERSETFVGSSAHVLGWAMEVALGSGLRISEVAALRNGDVDLVAGRISVTGTLVDGEDWKTLRQNELKARAQARVIDLPRFAVQALRAARAEQQTVPARLSSAPAIRGRGQGYVQPRNLGRTLREIRTLPDMVASLAETGLVPADLTTHIFRRTAATLAAASHGDLAAAQRLLGHADVRTTEAHYAGAAWRTVGSAAILDEILGETA